MFSEDESGRHDEEDEVQTEEVYSMDYEDEPED
jgi:hypothetical protein